MNKERWLLIGAFFCTYVVWGSTYLANFLAIQTMPVFGMGAARFLAAGILLYTVSLFFGNKQRPTLKQWGNASIQGALFLSIGVGAVVWAQQFVPTSTTALIISFEPLLVMLLMWTVLNNRPPGKAFIGAGISILGMFFLIQEPATFSGEGAMKGLAAILFGMSCWAVAILLGSKLDMGENKFRSSAMQMLAGGTQLLIFSFIVNDWAGWSPDQVSTKSFLAWSFLVVFGAVLAFSAFNYLLRTVSADMAATNTYVNPVVAVFLGWMFNNEIITGQTVLAGGLLLVGVWFINSAKRNKEPEPVLD